MSEPLVMALTSRMRSEKMFHLAFPEKRPWFTIHRMSFCGKREHLGVMTLQQVTSALKGVLGESFNSWLSDTAWATASGFWSDPRQNPSLLMTSRAQNGRLDLQSGVQ